MKKWIACFAAVLWLTVTASAEIIPLGQAIGIEMEMQGVLVVSSERSDRKIAAGDLICAVDGAEIRDAAALAAAVREKPAVTLELWRDGTARTVRLDTVEAAEGRKLGLYVRDRMTGIGTMTYYDTETGEYGALGHGVSEDTGAQLLPLRTGRILDARIVEVEKGEAGAPGRLCGSFAQNRALGTVERNSACGVFGHLLERPAGDAAELGAAKVGDAEILATVDGETVERFAIHIDAVEQGTLRMTVRDPALKRKTGGIVQGMSGSPILQEGRLVGAVTHVLVDDPTRGCGIAIEQMLQAAG